MKIFVTGGTGFIGKHVIEKLLQLGGYEIIVLTRQAVDSHNGALYLKGDLSDKKIINEITKEVDYVVHLAGCKKDPQAFLTTNVIGTENIISACSNSRIRKLLHLSSVGVIGRTNHTEINEQTLCRPSNGYEKSKYQAELLVKQFSISNPGKAIILRPTNVFGENDPEQHLLNLFTKIRKNQFYFVGRDLSKYYLNYLYVKEISELIPNLLTLSLNNDLYILNTPVKLSEFIMKCKHVLMDENPTEHLPYWPVKLMAICADLLPRRIKKYSPINSLKLSELTNKKKYSSSLLKKDLNWSPAFKIDDALQNLMSHYNHKSLLS